MFSLAQASLRDKESGKKSLTKSLKGNEVRVTYQFVIIADILSIPCHIYVN